MPAQSSISGIDRRRDEPDIGGNGRFTRHWRRLRTTGCAGGVVGLSELPFGQGIEQAGGQAVAVACDVRREPDVIGLFDHAQAAFGPVSGLINNAGVLAPAARLAAMDLDRWNDTIATNLTGAFLCAREAVRRMATSTGGIGGAIVNLSSMAAVLGAPNEFIDYAASKGAIDTLTIGLAKEVAAEGIRVNGVRPGLIDTAIHAASGDPDRAARLVPGVPMQRTGTPEEVAHAVVWLLSDEASYCTGVTIDVSGGR
jgi:NAD(P)-dependent dehydrogenase (short-subunit alcohol dehydrogenase family)